MATNAVTYTTPGGTIIGEAIRKVCVQPWIPKRFQDEQVCMDYCVLQVVAHDLPDGEDSTDFRPQMKAILGHGSSQNDNRSGAMILDREPLTLRKARIFVDVAQVCRNDTLVRHSTPPDFGQEILPATGHRTHFPSAMVKLSNVKIGGSGAGQSRRPMTVRPVVWFRQIASLRDVENGTIEPFTLQGTLSSLRCVKAVR
ncbi:hypothetical protein [Chelativorans alearense]|uniref:hypothetical protein n=1 Tax=Chelativorans alearense TaxID=2681495 RepID=UPI0013D3F90F|nr:hypothetical protein [Chelativorans alearense]